MIVRGAGCSLMSARELKAEIDGANERIRQEYQEYKLSQGQGRSNLAGCTAAGCGTADGRTGRTIVTLTSN